MKPKLFVKCCSAASVLLFLCVWCAYGTLIEKVQFQEEFQHQVSPSIIKTDSTTSVDWDMAEDILMQYVSSVERHLTDSCTTQNFYDTVVNYYMLNNPSDGALGEILSNTTYSLFESNDSLCSALDKFMRSKRIPANLCDTIWYRIAMRIQCYLMTDDDGVNIEDVNKNNILFLINHGYWLDNIEDYLSYTSDAR